MNIFYLDKDPIAAAVVQYNKHVVKMILEAAQMLCTAHHCYGDKWQKENVPYKQAHLNHPSTIWARENASNYEWLFHHFCALSKEYKKRYGKTHLSYTKCFHPLSLLQKGIDGTWLGVTKMPQCMPDEFKEECSVSAYRHFYNVDKRRSFKCVWTDREEPQWWKEHTCLEVSL